MDRGLVRKTLLVAGMLTAMGCAGKPPAVVQGDTAMQALAEAADSIHKDLNLLTQIHQQRAGVAARARAYQTPSAGKIVTPITLKWAGPLEPALEIIAEMTGYAFKRVGSPPSQPVLVQLEAMNQPAFEVLEDLGWQAGDRVGVVLNQKAGEVQIIYVGSDS